MRPMAFRRFTVAQATQGLAVSADAVALALIAGRRLQTRPRRAAARPLRVLDVGTGTAVIALVLRQLLPAAAVGAIELDEAAFAQVRSRVRRWPPSPVTLPPVAQAAPTCFHPGVRCRRRRPTCGPRRGWARWR